MLAQAEGHGAAQVGRRANRAGFGERMASYSTKGGLGQAGQTVKGSFSAVSLPNFAIKASFGGSRRDLHNKHI